MSDLWPRLEFEHVGALDYVVPQYDPAWLHHAAQRLQADDGLSAVLGPMRWQVGECLRQLSETPAALAALNHYTERAPAAVRGLNIALHYATAKELLGAGRHKQARATAAKKWGIETASVKDAHRRHGRDAARELETIVKLVTLRGGEWTRIKTLEALADDLADRAKLPWFSGRKAARKRGRRKRTKIRRLNNAGLAKKRA